MTRSRPHWPLLTVVLNLLVLYVVSFGPACWASFGNYDRWITLNSLYRPLLSFSRWCEPARRGLEQYANLAAPDGLKAFVYDGVAVGD